MTNGPVLSRIFAVARLGDKGGHEHFVADPDQCRALAAAFGLVAVDRLEADLNLRRWRGHKGLAVDGRIQADVVQTCVVSLDPVPDRLEASFSRRFLAGAGEGADVSIDPQAEDPPDDWNGRDIDLGAIIEEEFALNLDPYPRKPGAELANS